MSRAPGIIALILMVAADVHAEDAPYTPPDFLAVTPPLPASLEGPTVWRLDLAQALQVAVRQNLDVVLERKSAQIARLGVDGARGVFEPVVTAGYAHADTQSPPATSQAGARTRSEGRERRWRMSIGRRFTPKYASSSTSTATARSRPEARRCSRSTIARRWGSRSPSRCCAASRATS
jgi:hypothetical protein